MKLGERYLNEPRQRMRCRAVTKTGAQCARASRGFVCGVAVCTKHRKGMKPGVPFNYVEVA